MIYFHYETDVKVLNEEVIREWIKFVVNEEKHKIGEINYIFCSDEYLHKINLEFLGHDTYTDIISFDHKVGKELHGDIYISTDRVLENSENFKVDFQNELSRVIIHGILHFCGYKDKSAVDQTIMRGKEDHYLLKVLG